MFFKNLKNNIIDLAKNAVIIAESEFGSGQGAEKKKMAVDYIIKNLNVPIFYKNIISVFLSGFIDDVIELAVVYMKSLLEFKEK